MKKTFLTFGIVGLCAFTCVPAFASTASKESCPTKTLGEFTVEGTYIKETPHEGYYGFLVEGKDGKLYDIGIGNDITKQFEGIQAGNTIKIPFYSEQFFDASTNTCVVNHYLNEKGAFKGSYSSKNVNNERIAAYKETLKNLPKDTKPIGELIALAKNAFFKTFNARDSEYIRTEAFKAFYTYYNSILSEINKDADGFLSSLNANTEHKARNYAKRFGFMIEHMGEGMYGALADNSYLKKTFKNYFSEEFELYFSYWEKHPVGYLQRNIKKHDDVRQGIILAETLLKKYPDSVFAKELKENMLYDIQAYIRGVDGYSINAGGYRLAPAVKNSFEKFLKQNKDSQFYDLVTNWYEKLQKDKFNIDYDYAESLLEKNNKTQENPS